ncbi:DUF6162 family protein [Azospirillum doebereinerae]|uniref:DUF6162 family protein n=1 Tax=Azospirillum doebereinerae TaxID=92933 RepID=UPI001EE52CC3|nr:DUF6162 family protein [Azospirillum doebereinerae]MCG5241849.1 DUF6162 family protein [Azospirillum doebereinerae]
MHHQIVRRAGAERETAWVLLASAAILACAVVAVGLRPAPPPEPVAAAHQIDSRTGLTSAEQGLHADLKVAGAEIAALLRETGAAPKPAELAAQALPPFARDTSATARGGHAWTLAEAGHGVAYAGVSAAPELAGSMVLVLDTHGKDHAEPQVWLKRAAEAPPPGLDEKTLAAAGWKQVTATFTAGVTR